MADRNRGGRSAADDDPIDDESNEESYDDADFDDELDHEDDLGEDDDKAPAKRSRTAASARTLSRTRTKVKDDDGPGLFGKILRYFREIVAELQKVIWPTRKELLTYTTVVIVFVTIVMSVVAGLDVGFARLMFLVFGSGTGNSTN